MSENNSICNCGCCAETTFPTPEDTSNFPGLTALKYRVGTHYSFRQRMLGSIVNYPALNRLTARYDDDFSIATLDAWAAVLDVLTFYQERIINEGYLRTASERLSVLELARHISYHLKPGVAAGTFLAFSMNEAPGAPPSAVIPIGTKVQSVPEQNQLPQIFETTEQIEARVEWNAIKLQTQKKFIPVYGSKEIYVKGIVTGLQPGDGILMIGDERKTNPDNENWDFRKVKEVLADKDLDITRITWSRGLGAFRHGTQILPAAGNFKIYALRQKASLFGYNAPDIRVMSEAIQKIFKDANKDEWKEFSLSSDAGADKDTIYLDTLYPKIVKSSWVIVSNSEYDEVYEVKEAADASRTNYSLTAKTTTLQLSGENLIEKFDESRRSAIVYAQSEELEIADKPVDDAIADYQTITLATLMPGLYAGQNIIISGKRMRIQITESAHHLKFDVPDNATATRELAAGDELIVVQKPENISSTKKKFTLQDNGGFIGTATTDSNDYIPIPSNKDDEIVSELHTIKYLVEKLDPTTMVLEDLLANLFDAATVTVNANIAAATHGETNRETLGSGNTAATFQKFVLKQSPLTYVSDAGPAGTKTTLQIMVNDILWKEVPSFYGISPKEKVYTTTIADDEKVTVQFGDGVTGARLPGGAGNVNAEYRVGIGHDGLLHAGQLSMLMTPQLGVSKVTNPLDTSGADDPETLDTARTNAPLTVLTLDRIVSAQDFEDFVRGFAGIGKAVAQVLWNGEQQEVYITVAATDGAAVDENSHLFDNLTLAIENSAHTYSRVTLFSYTAKTFNLAARIQTDTTYIFDKVKEQVTATLQQQFSFQARAFGQDVTLAEIMTAIQGVEGVIYVDLEALNNKDPFGAGGVQRIASNLAVRSGDDVVPAELLTISDITITQIL